MKEKNPTGRPSDEYFVAKAEGEAAEAAYWAENPDGTRKEAREIGYQAHRTALVRMGKLRKEPSPPEPKWTREEARWAKEKRPHLHS